MVHFYPCIRKMAVHPAHSFVEFPSPGFNPLFLSKATRRVSQKGYPPVIPSGSSCFRLVIIWFTGMIAAVVFASLGQAPSSFYSTGFF